MSRAVPSTLREREQWIAWRTECRECSTRLEPTTKMCPECGEKATKKPITPQSGGFASSTDSDTWGTFDEAVTFDDDNPDTDGIGFVFDGDGLVAGIDLDDCRDPETDEIDEWATEVVDRLDSFTEVSPSGTGLHIYVLGFVPDGGNRAGVGDGEIEIYDSGRYFTVTGEHLDGTPEDVEQRNDALSEIHAEYVTNGEDDGDERGDPTDVDVADADGTLAFETRHGDGLAELRERDEKLDRLLSELTPAGYTDDQGNPDTSRADLAAANKLWFWGFDERQISKILRTYRSRGKIRKRDDYVRMTISEAKGGDRYEPAKTDGGATTANAGDGGGLPAPDTHGLTGEHLKIVLGEDDDADLGSIPANRLANGIEQILRDRDDVHIRLLDTVDAKDQPIYSMAEETKVWRQKGERRVAKLCREILEYDNSKKAQRETVNALRASPSDKWLLKRDRLGVETGELAVQDGVLDLKERDTRAAKPEDYLQGRLPVEFDPGTEIDGTRFEEFLIESVDPQDLDKLQEYAGYCLLKNAQPYKKALFLVGPTDSGKGTFLKTLEMILGDDNVASETLYNLVNTRWGTHSIYGNMVNVSNEVSPSGLGNVGQFKMLTGGEDKVPAEDKGVSKYRFTVTQKFLFATNEFPEVEDADEAFYNRLLFVKFPHSVPDDEKEDLRSQFREERSAILNWMLDGLDRLRENGGAFTGERSIDDKKEITKAFGSTVEQFAHAALDVTGDSDHVVHKKELYSAFTRYCDYINEDTPTQTQFTRELKEEAGISDGKSTRVHPDGNQKDVFKGAKLNEDLFSQIQADLPTHSYERKDGGQQSLT